ncbi:hypothetical protein [Sulfurospirillum sp. 1612]|uniref:hypothetical protein n=1 Tax=Sulfurospirillum sp. 1612 TaxID=3094835 RepID=UPI002F95F325
MKTIKIGIAISILFLFQGCLTQQYQTINIHKGDQRKLSKPISKTYRDYNHHEVRTYQFEKPAQNNIYNGSIKGRVTIIQYDQPKKSWFYEIKGTDTKNYKLPYARFYNKKKLVNRGDRVYVILKNSHLQKLYFIDKSNKMHHDAPAHKTKRVIYKGERKVRSTDIALPQEERINF